MLKYATRMMFVVTLLAATCSGARPSQGKSEPSPGIAAGEPATRKEDARMTLSGTLAETVEKGGWVLNTDQGMYLLVFDQKYRQEEWFRVGAKVKVTGEESRDTVTIFMQGTPFKVEKMEPVGEDQ